MRKNVTIPIPLVPFLIRRGTWLLAALYYMDNFIKYKSIVHRLAEDDTQCSNSSGYN